MYWVNGEEKNQVEIGDRSFQYGDGGFTTMLVKQGKIQHWPFHQQRLQACLDTLGIQSPNWSQIEEWLDQIIAQFQTSIFGLKIHISRGVGGRGYSSKGFSLPNVTISQFSYPAHYRDWQHNGIELGICQRQLGLAPLLAGHKHNNRLEQIMLKAECEENGYDDAVVSDLRGYVTETTIANLFWFKDGVLHTPELTMAGVAGVMRRVVMEKVTELGATVEQGCYTLDDVLQADEVFITNSVLEVVPVTQIQSQAFAIGEQTLKLQERVLRV